MAATPVGPKPVGKAGFGTKLLQALKTIARRLIEYAIDQLKQNPAVVVTAAAKVATGAASKLPKVLVKPTQTLIAVGAGQVIKSAVTPAAPEKSATQKALDRLKGSLHG